MKPALLTLLCCALFFVEQAGGESPKAASRKREIIRIPHAPSSPLYSQAVKVGSTILVTGIVGLDRQTNKVAGPTIQDQTRHHAVTSPARSTDRVRGRFAGA